MVPHIEQKQKDHEEQNYTSAGWTRLNRESNLQDKTTYMQLTGAVTALVGVNRNIMIHCVLSAASLSVKGMQRLK